MDEHREKLFDIISRHLSVIHAGAVLERAITVCGVRGQLEARDVPRVSERLLQSASLFLAPDARDSLRRDLGALRPKGFAGMESITLRITHEQDVSRARAQVRELCMMAGAPGLAIQKAATIASELTRNIVSYTHGGELELSVSNDPPTLSMVASDEGPGIANLDEIMGGRYRSRTGLGLGLLGSKRLSDGFDVQTSTRGTCVTVEVRL